MALRHILAEDLLYRSALYDFLEFPLGREDCWMLKSAWVAAFRCRYLLVSNWSGQCTSGKKPRSSHEVL